MSVQKGSLVLLKVKDNVANEYKTIGGLRTTKLILNNQLIDATTKTSGRWRELLVGGGISFITISGSGIFTNSISEKLVRDAAFNNQALDFQLCFGNGDVIISTFQITSYERSGDYDQEEIYSLTIESASTVQLIN
jgi:TP901-1 family phage major tail protein